MMSNVKKIIIAVAAVTLVAGCTDDEASSAPADSRVQTADVTAAPGDIAPSQVFALDHGAELVAGEDRVSLPLTPQEALTDWEAPEGLSFKETTIIVEAGSAPGRVLLPVDAPAGAKIYLASRVRDGTLEEQAEVNREVLADVKLFDPSHETQLNLREARDRPERPTEAEAAAGRDAEILPSDPLAGEEAPGELLDPTRPQVAYAGEVEDRPLGAIELPEDAPAGSYILEYGPRAAQVGLAIEVRLPESGIELNVAPSTEQLMLSGSGHVTARLTDGTDGLAARIAAASSPRLVKEGDLIRWLDLPVEIEVAAPDRYEVTGTLVWLAADGTERPVARAQTANVLRDDGSLTLRFDAGHLRLLGEQGRFELRHLTLYAQGQGTQQHRITGGLGLTTPEVEPSELAEAEITPGMEELMDRGAFGL